MESVPIDLALASNLAETGRERRMNAGTSAEQRSSAAAPSKHERHVGPTAR